MTFDMEKARTAYEKIRCKEHIRTDYDVFAVATYLPAALDEIERLQRENLELNVATMGPDQTRAHQGCVIEEQAKRIAELEGNSLRSDELDEIRQDAKTEYALSLSPEDWRRSLRRLLAHCDYLNCAWVDDIRSHLVIEDRQRAALKKLGKRKAFLSKRCNELLEQNSGLKHALNESTFFEIVNERNQLLEKNLKQAVALQVLGKRSAMRGKVLVEERAKDGTKLPELCDIVHDELMCPSLEGDCEHWEGCPRKDELRQIARQQLRQDGKI